MSQQVPHPTAGKEQAPPASQWRTPHGSLILWSCLRKAKVAEGWMLGVAQSLVCSFLILLARPPPSSTTFYVKKEKSALGIYSLKSP